MGGVESEFDGGSSSLKGADWLRRKMPASDTRVVYWEGAEWDSARKWLTNRSLLPGYSSRLVKVCLPSPTSFPPSSEALWKAALTPPISLCVLLLPPFNLSFLVNRVIQEESNWPRWLGISTLAAFLAMLSKETGIMILPISIVYFFMRKKNGHVARRADCYFWVLKYKAFLIPVIAVSEPLSH